MSIKKITDDELYERIPNDPDYLMLLRKAYGEEYSDYSKTLEDDDIELQEKYSRILEVKENNNFHSLEEHLEFIEKGKLYFEEAMLDFKGMVEPFLGDADEIDDEYWIGDPKSWTVVRLAYGVATEEEEKMAMKLMEEDETEKDVYEGLLIQKKREGIASIEEYLEDLKNKKKKFHAFSSELIYKGRDNRKSFIDDYNDKRRQLLKEVLFPPEENMPVSHRLTKMMATASDEELKEIEKLGMFSFSELEKKRAEAKIHYRK